MYTYIVLGILALGLTTNGMPQQRQQFFEVFRASPTEMENITTVFKKFSNGVPIDNAPLNEGNEIFDTTSKNCLNSIECLKYYITDTFMLGENKVERRCYRTSMGIITDAIMIDERNGIGLKFESMLQKLTGYMKGKNNEKQTFETILPLMMSSTVKKEDPTKKLVQMVLFLPDVMGSNFPVPSDRDLSRVKIEPQCFFAFSIPQLMCEINRSLRNQLRVGDSGPITDLVDGVESFVGNGSIKDAINNVLDALEDQLEGADIVMDRASELFLEQMPSDQTLPSTNPSTCGAEILILDFNQN